MCDRTFTIKDGKITSDVDTKKMAKMEDMKKEIKIKLSISDKIVDKLVNAGYSDVEAMEKASVEELAKVLGDANKAKRIAKRVALLKALEDEKVE